MDLSCAELVELVTEYVEGALSADDRRRFETHVGECGHCAEYLEQLLTTIALTGRLREDALRPDARAALLEAFRGWR
jgi:anti-sigma factor RsiW